MTTPGTLYGLGVGPGDPELLTLRALRILQSAPVLAYPAPEAGDSMARSIVRQHLPGNQIEIAIRMPLHASRFPLDTVYDAAAATIAGHLEAGRDVALLCEGDPFVYGSFQYLFARLADDWQVEVVPGITSITACAARLGTALAAHNDRFVVVPATLPAEELRDVLRRADSAAILKLGRHFSKVRDLLDDLNLTDRCHYIERATLDSEQLLAITDVDPSNVPYFSMILVHRRGAAWT